MFKAEWTNKDSLDLQPTCNQLATKRTYKSLDAVEVVRCKDCVFYRARQKNKPWNASRKYCIRSTTLATQPEDFCSYGKRKEKEREDS